MFDRTKPVNTVPVDADFLRAQLNDLDDRVKAIVPVQGPKGDKGDKGDQGDPGVSFPYPNNAQIDASLFVQGELALFESDPNGSGESGVRIGRASAGGVSVPVFTSRLNGAIPFGLIWDIGGFADGAGSPTIQDGALYRVDLASGMFKPWNVTVQTIQALDAGGNPITLQVICPPA